MNEPRKTIVEPGSAGDCCRRAVEELRRSLLNQQSILDNIPDIAWLKDREGRFVAVNGPFGEACGVAPAQIVGRTDYDIWPRELAEGYRADDATVIRTGKQRRVEERLVGADGRESWIETIKTPIADAEGAVIGTTGIARNITERRLTEQVLRRRTQGLATLLDVSKSLASTLDLEVVLQATTDGVTKLFGLDTAAVYLLEGDRLRLGATSPPLPPRFPEELRIAPLADHPHLREAIASGRPVFVPDMQTADLTPAERSVAEQRGLRTLLFLPLIAGVKSVGSLIVGSVTDQRSLSDAEIDLCRTLANLAALALENARLYAVGQQRAADLELQMAERHRAEQERLELERRLLHAQKLESLGILAGGIAHDFNNLLMAVLGNLDLALGKIPRADPIRANIEQSARAAHRAADLTRQMLAYSGKGRFVVEAADLNELVGENAELFRAGAARTTTLTQRLTRPLPAIGADPGQVQQVIMNLIANASEAIDGEAGAITLTTGVQDCDEQDLKENRTEAAPPGGRYVFLEVSDTGKGMDEQTRDRLFDPFFSTKGTGRGLGMSAILGIVHGHRGAIFVRSAVGAGTAIRVLFPALDGPAAAKVRPSRSSAPVTAAPAAGAKVLVVDDEEMVRTVCSQMIEAIGMRTFTAADGREAVELFGKHADEIGLVILDLSMPNMDGRATFAELVRIRPGVRVILSSGFNEQESVRRLCRKGLAGFIQKPYTLQSLRDALASAGFGRA